MNHGLPVIASSIGGIPELIKSNYNGYLFEPKNKNELENILKYVFLLRREKYRLLMKNALNESRKYNLSSFINKLEEIIYSICDLTLKNKK
jgi:glycosyltransferase involved in cell wall biosynthesis